MRSLLALIAAVAMIVGALYFRGSLGGDGIPALGSSEPVRVVCATELRSACDALAADGATVSIAEAGTTAAQLAAGAPEADVWITVAPWLEIVAEQRQRNGLEPLGGTAPSLLGRSPLVMAIVKDRADVLTGRCGEDAGWRCIGQVADKEWEQLGGQVAWGPVKPGHADPSINATGLLVLGQAVSDFLGTADFSSRALEDDKFLAWFTALEQAVPTFGAPGSTPLQQMIQQPGRFDVVGTTEAEAGPQFVRSASRVGALTLRYPKPLVVADAVLAPLGTAGDDRAEQVGETARSALARAGWRVEGQPAAQGVPVEPTLPEQSGVPPPGVLEALRVRWGEITR